MKFIKIYMSKGDSFTFPAEEAKRILTSADQLVPIKEKDGKWWGRVINKAHIVSSGFDDDRELEEVKNIKLENEHNKFLTEKNDSYICEKGV